MTSCRTLALVCGVLVSGLLAAGCGGEQRAESPTSEGNRMPAEVQADIQKRMGGTSTAPPPGGGGGGGAPRPGTMPAAPPSGK